MAETKKRRPLHFALSGALLVPGLAAGCGPDEDGPMINVPAPEEPQVQETANPVGEEPPPTVEPPEHPDPVPNLTVEEATGEPPAPPAPTPNPSGDVDL